MLRKEQRRHERRSTFRRRLLAGSTAVILTLGMAAGGAAPAFAVPSSSGLPTPTVDAGGVTTYDESGLVCSASSIGFQKPDALDGNNLGSDGTYSAGWGTISWDVSTRTVTWSIVDGWDVDICVKGGTVLSLLDTSETPGTSYTHTYAGLSHLGFRINASTPGNDLDCLTATNMQGRALTSDDHITMDIVQDGSPFQVTAQIDIRQSDDPDSESGLVVRVTAPGGPYTLPLSNAERDSGVFSFSYANYLTGEWTVEWAQFTSTYFNESRDSAQVLDCGDGTTETLVEPTAVKNTCATGGASIVLPPVAGVQWFVNGVETAGSVTPIQVLETGDYTVRAEIDADADGGPYAFAEGAVTEWPFVFTVDDLCEVGEETFTTASIGFVAPTCELGQRLDPTKLVVADEALAELQSYEEFADGSYEVIFVTIDADARFADTETPTPGRAVSEDGTVLTFTGDLLGPDRSSDCVTTVELTDPVTYVDSCLLGSTFTIYRVVGIAYTVFINDETPIVVEWVDAEQTRTYAVEQGDSVRVEASPESDRYTISPEPAPFERTFEVYDDDCLPTLPLVEGSVTFIPATCLDATNRVVLPSIEGVQWWLDGVATSAGSWAMPAGEVVVDATPLQGFGFGFEAQTRWSHVFPAEDDVCELTTLAYTGTSSALVGLGFAAVLIMMAGFGVVIGRRFQQA